MVTLFFLLYLFINDRDAFWFIVKRRDGCLLFNFQIADSELAQKIDLSLLLLLSPHDITLVMLISH